MLLINTCGERALLALAKGAQVVAEESLPGREASEKIIPALRRLLAQAAPLEMIGVVHGPGSFTGVRVGLSVAKGLCETRGIGLVAMSRLALVALEEQSEDALAVLDAGRGEYYCGFYSHQKLERELILKREDLLSLVPGRRVLTCEPRVHDVLSHDCNLALVQEPGAFEMGSMVATRIAAGEWSDIATIDANYLRRTDAELLKEAK